KESRRTLDPDALPSSDRGGDPMHRKMLSVSAPMLAILAAAAAAYGSLTASGPRMGPPRAITRPAFHGYYDGHKDTYLNTDVSNRADAKAMHINYATMLDDVPRKPATEICRVHATAHE